MLLTFAPTRKSDKALAGIFLTAIGALVAGITISIAWSVVGPVIHPGFCGSHDCVGDFNNGSGYIVQCNDGTWSHSGGLSGACSSHGGERLQVVFQDSLSGGADPVPQDGESQSEYA